MNSNLKEINIQEIVDKYIATEDSKAIDDPKVSSLLIQAGFTDYLLSYLNSSHKVLDNKEIILKVLDSDYIKHNKNILVLKGNIANISIENNTIINDDLKYIYYEFIESSTLKKYIITDIFFTNQEYEDLKENLKHYINKIAAIVKSEDNIFKLECFLKLYDDINY